jgi:cell wall-associated NlpC family hydrolase
MVSVIYEHCAPAAVRPPGAVGQVVALAWVALLAGGCASVSGTARPSPFPGSVSGRPSLTVVVPSTVVEEALLLRGTPYRLGGESPVTGLDCSGLVRHVFGLAGIDVPRTVAEQFDIGAPVQRRDIRAGDLIFFDTVRPGPSHVGIAIDADTFVHAPGSGGVVRVDRIEARYWRDRLRGIRRVGRPAVNHLPAAPSAGMSM